MTLYPSRNMENLCILYLKRTTIFQKLFQQNTELQEKIASLNHHTHIPTQELPGGLSFKIAFMHQKTPQVSFVPLPWCQPLSAGKLHHYQHTGVWKLKKKSTQIKKYLCPELWSALPLQLPHGLLPKQGHRESTVWFPQTLFKVWAINFKRQSP